VKVRRWPRTRADGVSTDGVPSWEDVARLHGDFLYTVAYRLVGDHHDAQDLVQEVLLRVQRGLVTYRPGSMEAWLGRITTNAFLDDVRRRRRRPVEALPDDYRAAVVLCDVVGLRYEEIADELGVPVGTVRSRIHRGRAQLRTALA
jgi:DNA-directed RNA polymerase specialized sigma24 family protein